MNDVQKRAHLDVAVDAARKAGALVKSMMEQGDVRVSEKHMNDFVTNADRASETLIISTIKERFPDESFLERRAENRREAEMADG